jgi:hypothetical protein
MKSIFNLKASFIVAALLALPVAQAATMSKDELKAAKTAISATNKADKAACASQSGNVKDICLEEAKAKDKISLAELEFNYTGKPADQTKLQETLAKSAYAVAKEKCDDLSGNPKDVCVKEAKAVEVKALAEVKASKQVGEARKDASLDKRDANYKVATEKCDALASDAKADCLAMAKTQLGKN